MLGTDPNWTSPTVTVWLIDVCFNSVWRTVNLSGWRDKLFQALAT